MISINSSIRYRSYESNENLIVKSPLICTSLDTDYIPFYSCFHGQYWVIKDFRYSTYWLDTDTQGNSIRTIGSSFKKIIEESLLPFSYTRAAITYNIMKHLIYVIEDGVPIILYTLAVHKDYWRIIDFENPDYSKFKIIVNSAFVLPRYKAFYQYFTKYIINDALISPNGGIDIIHTSDVGRYCFKPIEVPLQFTTIAAMKNCFSETTKTAIYGITGRATRIEDEEIEPEWEDEDDEDDDYWDDDDLNDTEESESSVPTGTTMSGTDFFNTVTGTTTTTINGEFFAGFDPIR